MIVAVDGPAGSGKSTIAKRAAQAVGFGYLDSGMLYRGISKIVLQSGTDREDPASVVRIAGECRFEISGDQLMLNGVPLEGIHNETIDRWSSLHSSIIEVRKTVNRRVREIVDDRDFIVMGRDIGTVVFPDAALKIYLDASIQARAARRYRQDRDDTGAARLKPDQIRRQIEERDKNDREKPFGKLEQAGDAIYIDTSDLTIDKVCDRVVREILRVFEKLNQSGA
jgi:cytidylate kinase